MTYDEQNTEVPWPLGEPPKPEYTMDDQERRGLILLMAWHGLSGSVSPNLDDVHAAYLRSKDEVDLYVKHGRAAATRAFVDRRTPDVKSSSEFGEPLYGDHSKLPK